MDGEEVSRLDPDLGAGTARASDGSPPPSAGERGYKPGAAYSDPLVTLYLGDCLEVMAELPDASVDAVVTDPPYGLKFMGKAWDHGVPAEPFWREMHRVSKPGAYLLAFGGTRTVHRIATNIEDSGWIIRDLLMWIYASGFPKGKANLKPAHEPIVLARKPGPLRPLAIDECRIGWAGESDREFTERAMSGQRNFRRVKPNGIAVPNAPGTPDGGYVTPPGRWPSNVLLSDPELFDEPNPFVVGAGPNIGSIRPPVIAGKEQGPGLYEGRIGVKAEGDQYVGYGDSGGYSRFFIVPKADRAERERGLADRPQSRGGSETFDPKVRDGVGVDRMPLRANTHPTVKPIDLMRHLVRLVTPVGGVVLDPFLGSGTTALATSEEGFRCIGIEREAEYLDIAVRRLMATPMGLGLDVPVGHKPLPKHDGRRPDRQQWGTVSFWGSGQPAGDDLDRIKDPEPLSEWELQWPFPFGDEEPAA